MTSEICSYDKNQNDIKLSKNEMIKKSFEILHLYDEENQNLKAHIEAHDFYYNENKKIFSEMDNDILKLKNDNEKLKKKNLKLNVQLQDKNKNILKDNKSLSYFFNSIGKEISKQKKNDYIEKCKHYKFKRTN